MRKLTFDEFDKRLKYCWGKCLLRDACAGWYDGVDKEDHIQFVTNCKVFETNNWFASVAEVGEQTPNI